MTTKKTSGPSITEAICDLLEVGEVRNKEVAETHYELLRQAKNNPQRQSFAVRGGKMLCLPLSAFRQLAVGTPSRGQEWVGEYTMAGASDLLSWSAARQAGATVLTGLKEHARIPLVARLPEPTWIPEVGMAIDTELETGQIVLTPKRLSAQITVSNQLLVQTGVDFDRILIADISRSLSSVLDAVALYGDGIDKPLGIANTPGTLRLPYAAADPFWEYLVSAEAAVASANVSMQSFGNIVSPDVWGKMQTTPVVAGGDLISEMVRGPVTSAQVTDDRLFFGSFALMVIGIFGNLVDLILNPYTRATSGQTQIVANLFADVGLRMPEAFGVSTDPIPVLVKRKAV